MRDHSSIGICAKIINNKREVLLIKRNDIEISAGIWEMPGGGTEIGESLEDAVVREVTEETGLKVERIIRYLGYFDFHNVETGKTNRKFCFAVKTSGEVKLSGEHRSFKWFPLSELEKLKAQGRHKNYDIWSDYYRIIYSAFTPYKKF